MLLRPLAIRALCMAMVVLTSLIANANIFGADRRVDLSPVPANLQPIGLLRAFPDDGLWGTAFLVGQCHILTAFHVAFPGHKKAGFVPSEKIKSRFYVGKNQIAGTSSKAFAASSIATPVAWGTFHTRTYSGLYGDWAVLKLADCLGRRFGVIALASQSELKDGDKIPVSHAGFPSDRGSITGISYEKNCAIRSFGPGYLVGVDCAILPGSSGGPVFEDRDGKQVAIGIGIRESRVFDGILPSYDHRYRNIVLRTEEFMTDLQRVLRESQTVLFSAAATNRLTK